MKIGKEKTRYHKYTFEYPFSQELLAYCRYIKKLVGWENFTFYDKKWRFADPKIILMIKKRYAEVEIDPSIAHEVELAELKCKETALIAKNAERLKKKKTSNLEIKGLKGKLYPYQLIGTEFFINNKGKAILADTMGLGKTVQALGYIVHQNIPKTLVICPASVKYVWEGEISKWTHKKSLVITSKTTIEEIVDNDKVDIFIINYDILKRYFKILYTVRWDCLILDEFHYIKNNAAQRTKLVKQIAKPIPSVLLLSGTPFLSRPVELFNGLSLMDPTVWNSWHHFSVRYCQGHQGPFGWDARGASNIEELQGRISKYFLRRMKEEVLPDLPEKKFINYPVTLDDETQRKYNTAIRDFATYLRDIKKKKADEISKSMLAEKLVRLGELRMLTTRGKIKSAEEIIEGIKNSGEKLVVFSVYNRPLEILHEKFKEESVLLTGKVDSEARKQIIDDFQNNDNIKVFFGGVKSSGIGITLTAASNVLFCDFSWNPADMKQCEDRVSRIGQKAKSIFVYQIYAKGTIDEYMVKLLAKKQSLFNQLFDDKNEKIENQGSLIDNLVEAIEGGNKL